MIIDFRSDTVTQPTMAMRQVMFEAPVGDDVYGEDPSVFALEQYLIGLTGMEAALYCPSGTQSNLVGLMAHCERGDEYIVGQNAHTYCWEGGGAAVLGSIQPQPIEVESDGSLDLARIEAVIKPINDHHPRSRLLCLENTNQGRVLPLKYLAEAKMLCEERGLALHMDGARVFNAVAALNCTLKDITGSLDSISICLSKGLGAPIGSVFCGSEAVVKKARRWRKVLGGGMRQVGIMAAAGLYALEHHAKELIQDHDNARHFAQALADIKGIRVWSQATNMVSVSFPDNYPDFVDKMRLKGFILPALRLPLNRARFVLHRDISRAAVSDFILEAKAFWGIL